jgi:subtilase family serine protease
MLRAISLIALIFVAATAFAFIPPHWNDWTVLREAQSLDKVTFHVGLRQRNTDKLAEVALSVSDPSSPVYRRFLSKDDVQRIVSPSLSDKERVREWLESQGFLDILDLGDAFKVVLTVSQAQRLLGAQFAWYEHAHTGHKVLRIAQGSAAQVDDSVAPLIELVTGLVDFPRMKKTVQQKMKSLENRKLHGSTVPKDGNDQYLYPGILRERYGIPQDLKVTNPKSTQAVMEFSPEPAPLVKDLQTFALENGLVYTPYVKTVGTVTPGGGTESSLDEEYITGIASGAQNWYWNIDDGWAYEMALELVNMPNPPNVVSVSYGWPEIFSCQSTVDNANCTDEDVQTYVQRSNVELSKVAAMGISMLICDQDEGAPSEANGLCSNSTHPVFSIFPGSSPWVTSVSASTVQGTGRKDAPNQPGMCKAFERHLFDRHACMENVTGEVVTNSDNSIFTTGGGFATFSPRPTWQEDVVAAYLKNPGANLPPAGKFPASNRGYPDVSAAGDQLLTYIGGVPQPTWGTSASTPIFAGVITLLNDALLNAGKPRLGFLNPLLYKMAAACPDCFWDVTDGSNACGADVGCSSQCSGYSAVSGWDAASGLGTPRFDKMLKYVLAHSEQR